VKVRLPESVVASVLTQEKVVGAPHDFYRYPARFSPMFVREAVKAFTQPGDLVLDPFCGGGTTVVEAMALGRRAAGMDINSLAAFLTRTKTTPISVHDKTAILSWLAAMNLDRELVGLPICETLTESGLEHYHRNLPDEARAFFGCIVNRLSLLPKPRQQAFVRFVLLSVGQRTLDCKDGSPSFNELMAQFATRLTEVLDDFLDFLTKTAKANTIPRCRLTSLRRVINRNAEGGEEDGRIPRSWLPAKLVLTSPPYPGVHVVYHRWQLRGRRETPAPFWLANQRDGAGESFYTLGRRDEPCLKAYFMRLESVFSSVRELVDEKSLVAQLVAFSDPLWQLPAYLGAMERAGFREVDVECHEQASSGCRIWRQVPGRKWYAKSKGEIAASKELLLLHKVAR
jgi:hypothetical protein